MGICAVLVELRTHPKTRTDVSIKSVGMSKINLKRVKIERQKGPN